MKSKFSVWFNENKVFIIGASLAGLAIVQQYTSAGNPNYVAIALAASAGVASYLAKNLRGQWVSILGIGANMIALISTQYDQHVPIGWVQILAQVLSGFYAIVAPAAKSISYERSGIIKEAKADAKMTDLIEDKVPPPPVGK